MSTISLRHVSLRVVEYLVTLDDGRQRDAFVYVGSGKHWHEAVRFPNITAGSAGESTGDDALDTLIRESAAEELVRLAAASQPHAA